jgi:hypothetical protein
VTDEQAPLFDVEYEQRGPHAKPRARYKDPETSHAAAESVNVTEGHRVVWRTFVARGEGMTDSELVTRTAGMLSPSGTRTRRAELTRMGYIRDSGRKKPLPSGRQSIVWERVPGEKL